MVAYKGLKKVPTALATIYGLLSIAGPGAMPTVTATA